MLPEIYEYLFQKIRIRLRKYMKTGSMYEKRLEYMERHSKYMNTLSKTY